MGGVVLRAAAWGVLIYIAGWVGKGPVAED
jgi:hypothetical protein